MSRRPLVPVLGLSIGDYLLWNWSLNGNHDVLALIAGLTLPPLAVACVWLLALSAADLIAATVRRQPMRSRAVPSSDGAQTASAAAAKARTDSRKLAA